MSREGFAQYVNRERTQRSVPPPLRRRRDRLKKGEGGVSISALLGKDQTEGREDLLPWRMFGHKSPRRSDDPPSGDLLEGLAHQALAVGGIHKDEIKDLLLFPQDRYPPFHRQGKDPHPRSQAQGLYIPPQDSEGPLPLLHKDRLRGPAAEGLKPQGTGAGEQVKDLLKVPSRAKDIEDRLADPVGGGPDLPTPGDKQPPSLELSADDPHEVFSCNRSTTLAMCP